MTKRKKQSAEPKKDGRPTIYTEALSERICAEIATGLSLRSISEPDDMPDKATVFRWLARHQEFCDQYARATECRTNALAEEILEIADDGRNDWVKNQDGGEAYNGDHVQRSKLRVDARKWLMSKMEPKKYGDKITQELTGKDGKDLNTGPTIIFSGAPGNTPAPKAVGGASMRGD